MVAAVSDMTDGAYTGGSVEDCFRSKVCLKDVQKTVTGLHAQHPRHYGSLDAL